MSTSFVANVGYIDSYDHTASEWRDLELRGLKHRFLCSGVEIFKITDKGVDVAVAVRVDGKDTRDLAQNAQTASYSLAPTDRDGHVRMNAAGATIITIPDSNTFPLGTQIAVLNIGAGITTITPAAGVILTRTGTGATGARALAQHGFVALLKISATTWYISGVGLS